MNHKISKPLVSIIIPSFNHAIYVRETIRSVCSQTWPGIEIIVIDDGSTDGSPEILKKLDIPNLQVYCQENKGTAATLNRGFDLAEGEYIGILNSDDQYHPERIKTLIQALEAGGPEKVFAFSRVDLMDQAGEPVTEGEAFEWLKEVHSRLKQQTFLPLAVLRDNFTCTSSNFLFRSSLIQKIGGFRDYRYVNDLDFLVRALSAGGFVFLEQPLLSYRIHDTNTLNERFGEKKRDYLSEWSQVVAGYLETGIDYDRISWNDLNETVGGGDAMQMAAVLTAILAYKKFGTSLISKSKARSNILQKISDALEFRTFVNSLKNGNERLEKDIDTYTSDIRKLLKDIEIYTSNIQNLSKENIRLFDFLKVQGEQIQALEAEKQKIENQNQALEQEVKTYSLAAKNLKNENSGYETELRAAQEKIERITQERKYFSGALEQVLNSRRFRFFNHLAAIKNGEQPFYHLRRLLILIAPLSLKIRLRRFLDNGFNLSGKVDRLKEKRRILKRRTTRPTQILVKNHDGPLLSVICPCYNYGQYLDRMLACLEAQTWQDFEVIILDDGSTDPETIARINALMAEDKPGRIVVRQENAGVIAARNHAASLASGKYLFPLDPDDTIEKTFLEKICFFLEHASPRAFAYAWTYSKGRENFIWETWDTDPFAVLEENRCGFSVFPREAFLKAGGYNPVLADGYEDWELCVNLIRHGNIGLVIPEPLYHYDVKAGARNHYAQLQHGILKSKINELHRSRITRSAKALQKEKNRRYEVINGLINLTGKPSGFRQSPKWLDLMDISFDPATLFSDLLAYSDRCDYPILVTLTPEWQSFFNLNFRPNIYVYYPALYHPDQNPGPFKEWISEQYHPEPLDLETIQTRTKDGKTEPGLISILYVGPWLITGGADNMTVDWFQQLNGPDTRLFYATTLPKKNVWIHKLHGLAQGIYELPELGCAHPDEIKKFMIDFIGKNGIQVLHVMNSPPVYEILPEIRKAHPNLRIVAQFHCFDFLSDGTKVGYSVDVPARLDGIIDRYNVESISHQREIQELFPHIPDTKFECIYGCIDSSYFDPQTVVPEAEIGKNRQPDCLNILFIGRLDFQKQPMIMMEVARNLRDAGVEFCLHVVGDGCMESQKSEVMAYWRSHSLENVVRFYGDQPLVSMPSWYTVGDVLLLTSMWEGIPIVLYQAMSMAKVCVAPDVGGIKELLGTCGLVIEDRTDIRAYVQALSSLASDPDLGSKIGEMARQRIVSQFDMGFMKHKYKAFYNQLILDQG